MTSIDDTITTAVVEGCSVPTTPIISSSQSSLPLKTNSALIWYKD
jgi:hypothetical protein